MSDANHTNGDFKFSAGAQTVTVTLRPQDRGTLVCCDFDGNITTQPVGIEDSVLNIKRDLIPHITAQPMPTQWLEELRGYLTARIQARRDTQADGHLIQATADGRGFERVRVQRLEVDDNAGVPSTAQKARTAGHRAAEAWYSELQERGDAAEGYFFPSGLRTAFIDLRPEEQGYFLDAIGALMVMWLVSGEPAPGKVDTAQEVWMQSLTPADQDAACDEEGA